MRGCVLYAVVVLWCRETAVVFLILLAVLEKLRTAVNDKRFAPLWCCKEDKKRGTRPAIFDGYYVEIGHYQDGEHKIFKKQDAENPLVLELRSFVIPITTLMSDELRARYVDSACCSAVLFLPFCPL